MGNLANDGELLSRFARAGDEAPFQELVSRHGEMVFQVCFRVLGNSADAEDAAQAVFLTLAQRANDFALQHSVSLSGWLHTLAWRVAMRLRAAADARRKHEKEAGTVNSPDTRVAAAKEIDWEKLRPLLDEALTNLPEKYRLPFVLCHLEERSHDEAAELLVLPRRTVSGRLERARELLRRQLEKRGVVLSIGVLSGLTAAQAGGGELSAAFAGSTAKAASLLFTGNLMAGGLVSGQSTALMHQALKILLWAKLKAAAVVLIVAGLVGATGLTSYLAFAAKSAPKFTPLVPIKKPQPDPDEKPQPKLGITIDVRSSIAWAAIDELERKGLRVVTLNNFEWRSWQNLMVPVAMRFKSVDAREFVETVAAARGLKVEWLHDDKFAVLHTGATDADVERCRTELGANDPAVRRQAAWRAGWLRDARAVPLLVNATQDPDAETARQALVGLRRLNWRAVAVLDERATALIAAELDSKDNKLRREAADALGYCSWNATPGDAAFDKELPLLEKVLADNDELVPQSAVRALGRIGGDKALAMLEKIIAERRSGVQQTAIEALGRIGGEKAFALLEKAIANNDVLIRSAAVKALGMSAKDGRISVEKVLPLLENAAADRESRVRADCIHALGKAAVAPGAKPEDRRKAQALLESFLRDHDPDMRWTAVYALTYSIFNGDGAKALPLLEAALADTNANVRGSVSSTVMCIVAAEGTGADAEMREHAFGLLRGQLADPDINIRVSAVRALAMMGGNNAVALLEKSLSDPALKVRSITAYELGNIDSDNALALLEKVLAYPNTKNPKGREIEQGGLGRGARADDVHQGAVSALSNLHFDKTLSLFEKAISSADENVHATAVEALGWVTAVHGGVASTFENVGGERPLAVLKKALADPDSAVRQKAAYGLGLLGGEQALALLEQTLADPDMEVRSSAVGALGSIGGERSFALAQKTLADKDPWMRYMAASALDRMGGAKACELIVAALKLETAKWGRDHMVEVLGRHFANEPSVKEAIKNLPPMPDETKPKAVKPPTAPPDDKF